jgi:hypothetical protein
MKGNNKSSNHAPKSEKRRKGVFRFPGITNGRLQTEETWQLFITITRTAAFTEYNLQTSRKRKGTGPPPLQPVPPEAGIPLAPSDAEESSETECVPPAYVESYTSLPRAQFSARILCAIKILSYIC